MVNVVKEAFNVYSEKRSSQFTVKGVFDVMCEGKACVNTRGTGHPAELFRGNKIVSGAFEHEAFCNNLLQ